MRKGETFLVLGGGGMIGAQIVHEIARELEPRSILICSRTNDEVQSVLEHCGAEFPAVEFSGFAGDVFIRSEWNAEGDKRQMQRSELIASSELRRGLFDDVFHDVDSAYSRSQLARLILETRPDVVVDSINTATAISYQDVYTASELARNSFDELKACLGGHNEQGVDFGTIETAERELETLIISQSIPQLIRHVLLVHRAMTEAGTRLYLKIGTTGTGGMGLNIPYTHSEDKPSARLMTKTAIGFAHTGLMFLMARTPGGPIVKELKPAAMVGYNNIVRQTICERGKLGKPLQRFSSRTETLTGELVLREPVDLYEPLGEMQMVVVDTGENGLFTKGEFEAITHMGQMEFITPEEIARQAVLEIRGSNTGFDVIAAIDSTMMNPTYRAGCLRQIVLDQLDRLESEEVPGKVPSVALGLLGPPELGKLLWEAYLLHVRYGTLDAVIDLPPGIIATDLSSLLEQESDLRQTINAVGLPILTPDGASLLRGPLIRIPEIPGLNIVDLNTADIDKWAQKGWIDLREKNFAQWRQRFERMKPSDRGAKEYGSGSVTRQAYPYKDIRVGAVVAWIFNNEIGGYRIK